MTSWLAPKKRCQTWLLILSNLRYEWAHGNETALHTEKQSNALAIWVERSIDDHFAK